MGKLHGSHPWWWFQSFQVTSESRNIITFMTPDGLMRWKVLIMEASPASEIYQWTLEYKVFLGLDRLKVISDDSIIYGRNQD